MPSHLPAETSPMAAVVHESPAPMAGSPTAAAAVPRLEPNTRWVYKFHPHRWGVIGGRVLPILSKLFLQPGVAGVKTPRTPNAAPSIESAKAVAEGRGWMIIPEDWSPEGSTYVRRVQVVNGWHWLSLWETAHASTDRITVNTAAYADWLAGLVESGKLPGPPSHVLDSLKASLGARLVTVTGKAAKNAALEPRVDEIQKQIEAIEDAEPATGAPVRPVEATAPADVEDRSDFVEED